MFRINNNSANPVNINTLSIKAWFLGTVTTRLLGRRQLAHHGL